MASTGPVDVVVVGGGLAGGVLALELAHRDRCVLVLDSAEQVATALSYGLLPPWAAWPWLRLQARHGPLGLRWQWARFAAAQIPPAVPAWPGWLPFPVAQVDPPRFLEALPAALAAAGVARWPARLIAPPQPRGGLWDLTVCHRAGPGQPEGVSELRCHQVVLAAGAGCRSLWPDLDPRLRSSWAGVLELEQPPPRLPGWPARALVPRHFSRMALEHGAGGLQQPEWVVDPGLVATGSAWMAGQISLVPPDPGPEPPPESGAMERHLRQGLAPAGPELAAVKGRYRQAPVAFCTDGVPLLGAVAGAPGLWSFTGFTAAFTQVPVQAARLARAIAAAGPGRPA